MATTVEVLAAAFRDAGTPFIVGHPGGELVELMEAARQRQMRFLLMKQEVAGAMLAATWGDLTGSPGICLSTRGPGAANMVNGVAHAFLDRSPLIAITDTYSRPTFETGLRQRINQQAIYEPVVKWSTVIDAKTVRQQVRRAMRTATATPPGPVHFEFPQSETTREAGEYVSEPPLRPNWITPGPDRADLKPALDMLNRAKRPILIAGMGVYWCGASAEFVKFAERLGAPVLTTTKCKGMIPEDHRLRAGCIIGGLIERKLVMESDLIVTVGLDAVELQPKPWPYTLPVLSLSSVPSTDALVPADPEIIGDLKALLAGLAQWAPEGANWGEKSAKTFRSEVRDALNTPATGLSPQRDHGSRPRDPAARHDRDLRCRRQPVAGGAEMGILRPAGIPHVQRPRLDGLCGARRARRPHGVSGSAGGGLHRRRRLPDDGRGIADRADREPADHRDRVRRPRDRSDPRQAGDQGHSAQRRRARRRRLGKAGAVVRRRRRHGGNRTGLQQCALQRAEDQEAPPSSACGSMLRAMWRSSTR